MEQLFDVRLMDEARSFIRNLEKDTQRKLGFAIRKTQSGEKAFGSRKLLVQISMNSA
jgi:hypothetical protein